MPGKGKDKDAEVDFFGDSNVDWLADEESGALPPPPPPPDVKSAVPAAAKAGETDFPSHQMPRRDARGFANAPTLIFSKVQTLPPMTSPVPPRALPPPPPAAILVDPPVVPLDPRLGDVFTDADAEADTVELPYAALLAGHQDAPTAPTEMYPTSGRAELVEPDGSAVVLDPATAEEPAPDEPDVPRAPDSLAPGPADPGPARVLVEGGVTPGPAVRVSATPGGVGRATPSGGPLASARPVVAREPTTGEAGWREVLTLLRAEADAAPPTERGAVVAAGGLVALRLASAPVEAESWFAEAHALGTRSPDLYRWWAEARGALGRWSDQESVLLELAEVSEEPDRAEARLEASLVAWRRRDRPDDAVRHLELASRGLPDDYTSRALQRALLPTLGRHTAERRLELLDEIVALAEGGIAADALVERATVAEELGRPEVVRACLEAALAAEPGHTFAFQRLERSLATDPAALAALYEKEAQRAGQPDPGFWWWRAARVAEPLGGTRASDALAEAARWGWGAARRELQGMLQRAGDEVALAESLSEELDSDGRAAPFLAFAIGWADERAGREDAAAAAYRRSLAADPTAAPAAEGLARLARRTGGEQASSYVERLAATTDPMERRGLHLRLAELAARPGNPDPTAIRDHAEAALREVSGGAEGWLAGDLLDLALELCGDRDGLRHRREARAEACSGAARVGWWLASASSGEAAGLGACLRVLDEAPDHEAALALAAPHLLGRPLELAGLLERAAAGPDGVPERRAAWLTRAARLLADHDGDESHARALLDRSLALDPAQVGARWLARSLVNPSQAVGEAAGYRAQADARGADVADNGWSLFAAAVIDPDTSRSRRDLERLLAATPDHPGAAIWLEIQLAADGDRDALLDLRQSTGDEGGQALLRNALDLVEAGRREEAILLLRRLRGLRSDGAEAFPVRPAARLAVALGLVDVAVELLAQSALPEDRTERARMVAGSGRAAEAMPLLLELAERGPDRVGVAARLATVAQQAGSTPTMIRAYAILASEARSPSLRAAYSAWTAMQMQAAGQDGDALTQWHAALAERPTSTVALLGAVRSLVARRDPDGVRKLFAMLRPEATNHLSEALRFVGDRAGAAEVLVRAPGDTAGERVASLLRAERFREEVAHAAPPSQATAAWQAVYDALSQRRELCRTEAGRLDADGRRRWLLAEKLATTDVAWDLYRRLHQEAPDDREVSEALASIAAARGETSLAIGYLRELSRSAPTAERAASYQRRIGEVHERDGRIDEARQAYLDALDHVRDDAGALSALRRLAERGGDWASVVAVLQREAGTASDPARVVALRSEIARVTEQHLAEPRVAIDAWRAVLELDGADRDALQHVLDLSAAHGDWGSFVEAGTGLVGQLDGPARSALERRLGVACLDHLGREDGVDFLERAAAADPPDLEALEVLERHARARADWGSVVRALIGVGRAHPLLSRRVDALAQAARLQVEAVHDKPAAAETWQEVLALAPDHEAALRFVASWLYESERFDAALPIFERLEPRVEEGQDLDDFDTRMELASFFFYFAEMLRRAHREEAAIARYERTLAFNPAHLPSLEAVGPLYLAAEAWPKAEAAFRQLVQLTGGQGEKGHVAHLYTQLGLVERRLGFAEKAYKRFSKALELQSNHVGALKGMALVLEDRQDWSNLLNVYNNVIYHATSPDDVIDAYMTKGRVLDDHMQRQDKAAQHYQRSLDFDPAQPQAYLRLAELAMRKDDLVEASSLVDKALGLDQDVVAPYRARLLLVRAACWQHADRAQEADRCLREARMLDAALVEPLGVNPLAEVDRVRRAVKDALAR